jgi:hypothetical protein
VDMLDSFEVFIEEMHHEEAVTYNEYHKQQILNQSHI